jgi:hypothetical protein
VNDATPTDYLLGLLATGIYRSLIFILEGFLVSLYSVFPRPLVAKKRKKTPQYRW